MNTPDNKDWDKFWSSSGKNNTLSWSKRRILKILQPYLIQGNRALDAGCGSGFFAGIFVNAGMQTTALDYSAQALAMAKQATQGNAQLIQADLINGTLNQQAPGPFDLVFTDGLFEHFPQDSQDKILCNLSSVLSDTGVIVTVVPNRFSPWEIIRPWYMPGIEEKPFVLPQLVQLHARNGLRVIGKGGINTLPWGISPEGPVASVFGMLLYVAVKK